MSLTIFYLDMQALIDFALETLKSLSPAGAGDDQHPGLYRDSHMVFLDGHNVANVASWQPGQQINISNPVPYARKIELGPVKLHAPSHVYETAAQTVAGRFGNIVDVRFVYMPVNFSNIAAYASFARREHLQRRPAKGQADWLVRQPALQINSR